MGVNRRFKDESLFVGKSLNAQGFGSGEVGRKKALDAALANSGSELIYQDDAGIWFAQEIGEADTEQDSRDALSKIDRDQIKLHPTLSTRQGMHQAFVSFKDDIADFEAPENPAELSSWQKLKVGNSHALRAIANEGMVWVKNPLSAGSDLAKGMVVNTWTTLRHPVQTFEAVGTTYQHDKVEGVIHGAKMAGSVVASAALVVGIGVAVGNTGLKLSSLRTGKQLHQALEIGASAQYQPLMEKAYRLSRAGQTLGRVGQVTGTIGKAASLTVLGATSLSLLKSEVDLARAKTPEAMRREVSQITQDAGALAQSAASYAINKVLTRLAEKTRQLYTENRNYQQVSPEAQAFMDQFIDEQSQKIAQRIQQEIPEFKPEIWKTLPEAEKKVLLDKINSIFVDQMQKDVPLLSGDLKNVQFEPPSVHIEDLPEHSLGYYSPRDNAITLNRSRLDLTHEIGNTLTHEGFHGFQQYMMKALFEGDESNSFGPAFDEHVYSWVDNNYRTGYASQSNNAAQRVLGIPADRLSEVTGIQDFIVETTLFPGLDSYTEYEGQPVETGAWRMGNQFESHYKTLNPLPEGP